MTKPRHSDGAFFASRGKLCLDVQCGLARISRLPDRATNNHMIGPIFDRLRGCLNPFLVAQSSTNWTDTWCDDQFAFGFGKGADQGGFLRRCDHTVCTI